MFGKSELVFAAMLSAIGIGGGGCYYPAQIQPPPPARTEAIVAVPYDLTWDALHTVVAKNDLRILGDDPNHGIIEADARAFTLADADCGQLKSIGSRYVAEPDPGGSAVYNFRAEPAGPQATKVTVNATYSTPVHVAFHPISDHECVSRGTQEARLLNEIETTARAEHRPTPLKMMELKGPAASHPSLLGPDILKRPKPTTR